MRVSGLGAGGPVCLILRAHPRQRCKKTRPCQLCSGVWKKEDSTNHLWILYQGSFQRSCCDWYLTVQTHGSHMQSMELSGISLPAKMPPSFAGMQDGENMSPTLGEGSTFSPSSILSATPSQLIWKRVTRGLEAKMFLWSWDTENIKALQWGTFKFEQLRIKYFVFIYAATVNKCNFYVQQAQFHPRYW